MRMDRWSGAISALGMDRERNVEITRCQLSTTPPHRGLGRLLGSEKEVVVTWMRVICRKARQGKARQEGKDTQDTDGLRGPWISGQTNVEGSELNLDSLRRTLSM
jgi:hypothetical protein